MLPLCPAAGRDGLLIAKGEARGTERMGSLGHPECCQLGTQTGRRHTPHLGPSPWKGNLSMRVPYCHWPNSRPALPNAGRGGGAVDFKQMWGYEVWLCTSELHHNSTVLMLFLRHLSKRSESTRPRLPSLIPLPVPFWSHPRAIALVMFAVPLAKHTVNSSPAWKKGGLLSFSQGADLATEPLGRLQ